MGKKNKGAKQVETKNVLDTVKQKGASSISKAKDVANIKSKGDQPKKNIKDKPKVVDQKKLQEVGAGLAKKKKNKNKKGKLEKTANGATSPSKNAAPKVENANGEEKIVKLSKREKNRVKSKMSKDIAVDGKSKLGLADPKLVARQLSRLKASEEPLSKAKQRKVLLLETLNKKLKKSEVKTPNTSVNSEQGGESSSDDDEDDGSQSDTPKDTKGKKPKSESRRLKDKLYLFVGNLPAQVTAEMVKEVFKSANVEKVKIPKPRRKKNKRFAFIKLADEESKLKALQFHGTVMGDKKITVLLSNKGKGKSNLMSANAKLNAERKSEASPSPKPVNGAAGKKSNKTKVSKKQKMKNKS